MKDFTIQRDGAKRQEPTYAITRRAHIAALRLNTLTMWKNLRMAAKRSIRAISNLFASDVTIVRPPKRNECVMVIRANVVRTENYFSITDLRVSYDVGSNILKDEDFTVDVILGAPVLMTSPALVNAVKNFEEHYGKRIFQSVLEDMGREYVER